MLGYLYDFSPHLINKFQHIFALKKKLQTYFTIQVGSTEILTTRRSFGLEKLGGGHINERFSRRRRDSQGQLIIKVIRKENL